MAKRRVAIALLICLLPLAFYAKGNPLPPGRIIAGDYQYWPIGLWVTNRNLPDKRIAWSGDYQTIAYGCELPEKKWGLCLSRPNGTEARVLVESPFTETFFVSVFDWSVNERFLAGVIKEGDPSVAWNTYSRNNERLFIYNLEQRQFITVANDTRVFYSSINWSADGRQLLYVEDNFGQSQFGMIKLFDVEHQSLKEIECGCAKFATWYPNDYRMVIGTDTQIYAMRPDGSDHEIIFDPTQDKHDGNFFCTSSAGAAFSPDGKYIASMSCIPESEHGYVYLIELGRHKFYKLGVNDGWWEIYWLP